MLDTALQRASGSKSESQIRWQELADTFRTTTFTTVVLQTTDAKADSDSILQILIGYSNLPVSSSAAKLEEHNLSLTSDHLILTAENTFISAAPPGKRSPAFWLSFGVLSGEILSGASFVHHLYSRRVAIVSTTTANAQTRVDLDRILKTLSRIQNLNYIQTPLLRRIVFRLHGDNRIEMVLSAVRDNANMRLSIEADDRLREISTELLGVSRRSTAEQHGVYVISVVLSILTGVLAATSVLTLFALYHPNLTPLGPDLAAVAPGLVAGLAGIIVSILVESRRRGAERKFKRILKDEATSEVA